MKQDEYAPFHMGFQSYSLREHKLPPDFGRQARQLQLSYVELYNGHLPTTATPEQVDTIRQGLLQMGLTVNAFGVEEFSADREKNRALFEFGRNLGVSVLTANPTRDAFDSLEELVAEFDIGIAIHNHGPEDDRWRVPEWIMESVKDRDSRIGACIDVGHFIRADVDPVQAIELLGKRVLAVHLKDFDDQEKDVVLGEGRLDLEATLAALKKLGFVGPLSLEFEGENPVPNMLECLKRIREALQKI